MSAKTLDVLVSDLSVAMDDNIRALTELSGLVRDLVLDVRPFAPAPLPTPRLAAAKSVASSVLAVEPERVPDGDELWPDLQFRRMDTRFFGGRDYDYFDDLDEKISTLRSLLVQEPSDTSEKG